ncbi:heterokaryon incompatibility protein-domain-containing protein [Podospora fimiseda]|uniref:Heterokaryon incompatibility protein-domain-containing protein n=1 Tax=Podospora fimiseda TaxID=252190 RepID=A0AAN7GS35_9PEZI|nr:heterokaryon incompatibility protein-domain-containing protein [Podospora fimiseda]
MNPPAAPFGPLDAPPLNNDTSQEGSLVAFGEGKLCAKCFAMTGSQEGLKTFLNDGYEHYRPPELQESATTGCQVCKTFLSGFLEFRENRSGIVNWETRLVVRSPVDEDQKPSESIGGSEMSLLSGVKLRSLRAEWIKSNGQEQPQEFGIVASPIALAEKHHNYLVECSTSTLAFVYESPIKGTKADYVTLSYCWGEKQELLTTKENLSDHLEEIPKHRLPETIANAVDLCRALGVRYLWVDSLCILQDDDEEKLVEIGNMSSICQSSTFTIIATSAEKVSDGFLGGNQIDIRLPLYIDQSTLGTIQLAVERWWDTGASYNQPGFRRAWMFQEYLLPPRALVFNSSQVLLKCQGISDGALTPILDTNIKFYVGIELLPRSVFGVSSSQGEEEKEDDQEKQFTTWKSIMFNYSRRNLSCFNDRLPALAGVATVLGKVWGDNYLAGLWEKTITQQLGWYRPLHRSELLINLSAADKSSGPSWSWATLPYPVHMYTAVKPAAKLIHAEVELVSSNSPYGPVKRASITLEALIIRAKNLPEPKKRRYNLPANVLPESKWTHHFTYMDYLPTDYCPDIERCRLIYLGTLSDPDGIFMIVEKQLIGIYRRVGLHRHYPGSVCRDDIMAGGKKQLVVLE